MLVQILRLLIMVILALGIGKLVSKLKLPSILGWLITGMVFGPHAFAVMNQETLDAGWYQIVVHVLECAVGLMIGTELVWNKIKRSGKSIVITTLTQSLGTFFVVSLVFGVVFYLSDIPVYLAFIFGGIALATAPAPALSIVREFNTKGPVTGTLIPMATLIGMILVTSAVGFVFNHFVMPSPVLNFMLMGMAFSAAFSNMVTEERLEQIMQGFNPILGIAMIIVILNLGAPLDYHLILGAGMFTAIYIIARAAGKYFGAYFGASVTKPPESVKKYLGLTLLPHSGVSLVFTGIAVSVLAGPAPDCAKIIQGTIAAAAVINEIIAVIAAKKGFEWAGEMQ